MLVAYALALATLAAPNAEYQICINPSRFLPKGCCNTYGLMCTFSNLELHVREMGEKTGLVGYHYHTGDDEAEFTIVKDGDSWTGQVWWKTTR